MNRREILGAAGLAALSSGAALAQGARAHDSEPAHHHDKVHEACLKACSDCAKSCDETFHHCVMQVGQGKKEHARSVQLLSDCAGFCGLSACMIAKHSPLMAHSCLACAEACKETAAEVGKFETTEMLAAVKALNECEKSCRAMVEAMGGGHHRDAAAKTS